MADEKVSTKVQETNTVEPKQEYYLPTYGITVEASSPEEALKVAQADKQE